MGLDEVLRDIILEIVVILIDKFDLGELFSIKDKLERM